MPVQADEKGRAAGLTGADALSGRRHGFGIGCRDCLEEPNFLRLDSVGVAEYVGLHGVCCSIPLCLGREFHNLWLGTVHAAQPTFTPESRHRFRFQRKP